MGFRPYEGIDYGYLGMSADEMLRFCKRLRGEPVSYLEFLAVVAGGDVDTLLKKDAEYGGSWKRRGGVGAFMMLARKWDRIEQRVQQRDTGAADAKFPGTPYDIFEHIAADTRAEGLLDDIRDLRAYLLLVEAEMMARGIGRRPIRPDQPHPFGHQED